MAVITAAFNPAGKNSGDQIAVADAGNATAWQVVNTQANQTYSNAHTLFGKTLAAKFNYSTAAGFLEWTSSYGSPATDYGRFYIYFDTLPNGDMQLLQVVTAAGLSIWVTSAAKLKLTPAGDFVGAGSVLSTTVLSTGQWYRLEYKAINTGATPFLKIYTSADSNTAAETLNGTFTVGTANAWAFGCTNANRIATFYVAQVVALGTSDIGPFPVSTTAPTVSGSAPVGSSLTCDGGTWNGGATFTRTYQWTRDGSNIASATSSSYTTVSADTGHAVGCTVTATGVQATAEIASQASSNTITVTAATHRANNAVPQRRRHHTGRRGR